MKITLRIPTEMYAYAELEINVDEMSPDQVFRTYKDYSNAFKTNTGIHEKEYSAFIDRYLSGEKNHIEEYQKMSDEQKRTVQVIKRSLARLKARGLIGESEQELDV